MTERLWCLACGTVTRDMLCDCNRWPAGHEMMGKPNFVNYADEMQKTAHEQAQQIETLVNALQATQGRIMNAKIDLQTGHTKAAGIQTLDGIIRFVDNVVATVTSQISQPSEKIEPSAS